MRQMVLSTDEASVMIAQPPTPKVGNRDTGEIARDRETGEVLMTVDVMYVADGEKAEVISVTVPESGITGELQMGTPVAITRLVARHWDNVFNGKQRCGHAYRATAITALVPAAAANGKG